MTIEIETFETVLGRKRSEEGDRVSSKNKRTTGNGYDSSDYVSTCVHVKFAQCIGKPTARGVSSAYLGSGAS